MRKRNGKRPGATSKSAENQQLIFAGAFPTAYDAALLAAEQPPDRKTAPTCSAAKPRFYLFERKAPAQADRRARRRPRRTSTSARPAKKRPHDGIVVKSRPGRSLVSELPQRQLRQDRPDGRARLVRAEGQPVALGHRHHRTEAGTSANSTSPTSPSTSPTRAGKPSRTSPARSPSAARRRRSARSAPKQAGALSGHFAVVLDNEVKTRPIINFAENPDGIDGRTGRGDLRRLQQHRRRRRNWRRSCRSAPCRST